MGIWMDIYVNGLQKEIKNKVEVEVVLGDKV
jgi:hypothetical protein